MRCGGERRARGDDVPASSAARRRRRERGANARVVRVRRASVRPPCRRHVWYRCCGRGATRACAQNTCHRSCARATRAQPPSRPTKHPRLCAVWSSCRVPSRPPATPVERRTRRARSLHACAQSRADDHGQVTRRQRTHRGEDEEHVEHDHVATKGLRRVGRVQGEDEQARDELWPPRDAPPRTERRRPKSRPRAVRAPGHGKRERETRREMQSGARSAPTTPLPRRAAPHAPRERASRGRATDPTTDRENRAMHALRARASRCEAMHSIGALLLSHCHKRTHVSAAGPLGPGARHPHIRPHQRHCPPPRCVVVTCKRNWTAPIITRM